MGSTTSTTNDKQEVDNVLPIPEVALFISDLVRESEPPFKIENDPDGAWIQHTEDLLRSAVLSKLKLNTVRFFFSSTMSNDKSTLSSSPMTPRKRAISLPKTKKTKKRAYSSPISNEGGQTQPETRERTSSFFSIFAASTSYSSSKKNASNIEEDLYLEPMKSVDADALLGGNFLHCAALNGAVRIILWAVQEPSLVPLLSQRNSHGLTPLGLASHQLAKMLTPLLIPASMRSIQATRSLLQYNHHSSLLSNKENRYGRSKENKKTSHRRSSWSKLGGTSSPSSLSSSSSNTDHRNDLNEDMNILDRARRYHAIIQIFRGCEVSASSPNSASSSSSLNGQLNSPLPVLNVKDVDSTSSIELSFTTADISDVDSDYALSGLALCMANGSPCLEATTSQFSGYGAQQSPLTWPSSMNNGQNNCDSVTSSSSSAAISPDSSDPSDFDSCSTTSSFQDDDDEDDENRTSQRLNGLLFDNEPTEEDNFASPFKSKGNQRSREEEVSNSPSMSNQLKFQQEQCGNSIQKLQEKDSTNNKTIKGEEESVTDRFDESTPVTFRNKSSSSFEQSSVGGRPSSPTASNVSTISNTTSANMNYKTYHITDITCYFNFYKYVALFESKRSSDGHLALEGFNDKFYTPLMYEACGWALRGCKSFKLMVPISNEGLASLIKPLLHSFSVQHIDCSRIGLSHKVPYGFGSIPSLTYLDLHENLLTGSIPGAAYGGLPNLKGLNLSNNSLNGTIPSSLFRSSKLMSSLWYLNLNTNLLTGSIPISLFGCTQLKELWLNHNSLKNEIPEAIGGLIHLECLFLNNNDFIGKIPNNLSKLKNLKSLYLQNNSFSGTFPKSILQLSNLISLSLNNNLFDGILPNQINLMLKLKRLNLSSNQFRGKIPKELGDLLQLRHLYLDHNKFTGTVPCEFLSKSPHLQTVNLFGNPQLANKGRSSKQITKHILELKIKRYENNEFIMHNNHNVVSNSYFKSPTSTPNTKQQNQNNDMKGNIGFNNEKEDDDENVSVSMSKVNVRVLTIDPVAPYSDDAENWRV